MAEGARAADGSRPRTPWELYAGANAGYAFGLWETHSNAPIFDGEQNLEWPKVHGALTGLQAGVNVQPYRYLVLGLEGDIQITRQQAALSWFDLNYLPRPGGSATLSSEWTMNWFGTGRLRVGVTPVRRLLLYGTGGVAFGKAKYEFSFAQPGAAALVPPTPTSLSVATESGVRLGYAVGGGIETKIDRYWSARAELLYLDFGTVGISNPGINGLPFKVDYSPRQLIGRLGLNFSFW